MTVGTLTATTQLEAAMPIVQHTIMLGLERELAHHEYSGSTEVRISIDHSVYRDETVITAVTDYVVDGCALPPIIISLSRWQVGGSDSVERITTLVKDAVHAVMPPASCLECIMGAH